MPTGLRNCAMSTRSRQTAYVLGALCGMHATLATGLPYPAAERDKDAAQATWTAESMVVGKHHSFVWPHENIRHAENWIPIAALPAAAQTDAATTACFLGHRFVPGPIVDGRHRQPTPGEIEART